MFEPKLLETIHPKGFRMRVKEIPPQDANVESDRKFYKAQISGTILDGTAKTFVVEFSIPIPNKGVFQINDLQRFVIPYGMVDLSRSKLGEKLKYFFKPRAEIVFDGITRAFDTALTDFFMSGNPVSSIALQNEIDGWFKTSKHTQEPPKNEIGLRSMWELIHLQIPDRGLDVSERMFNPEWFSLLDPASTPSGDKVNLTYRMVKGAKIVDGQIVPGKSVFCSTIEDYHMPVSLCPRRTHISRNPYESHIALDMYEDPLVGKPGLSGRHLLTAIMRFGTYTGEDAIVFSESAAEKMTSAMMVNESFHAIGDFHLKVKEGDYINPDMVIAETTDPVTGEKTQVRPKKWKSVSQIKAIRIFRSTYFGVQASRVRISCIASAPAQSGDKVFTRGAIKGVIRVIPDEMMPKLENGDTIEAIVSPDSVVGRRAMSVYWEGMANWYAQHGGEVIVDHFKPEPSFKELVNRGYGDGDFLWLGGEKLPEKTWFAPIYFVRLDKISHQIVSFQNGEQPVNGIGLAVDKASAGGQKRDFAKGAAMVAKGMGNILHTLIKDNLKAPHAIKELTKVLANADGVEVQTKAEIASV